MMLGADLLSRFSEIVGDRYVVTDPEEQRPYLIEPRRLYSKTAALVLRPGSVEEVAAVLKLSDQTATPIVPQGGNTGLVGGQVPHRESAEVILSLSRLNRIREIDADSNTITCEAGVILQKAQEEAMSAGRLFPLSFGAEGSATIGGALSSNAGGTGALAYGVARDLALGLEVVLADGRILRGLSKLKKDNTGYDLKNLFIGSEGTLGVITAAVLKLFPAPQETAVAFVGLESSQAAHGLLMIAQKRAGGMLTSFELMPRIGLDFVLQHMPGTRDPLVSAHPWYVVIELSSSRFGIVSVLEEILENGFDNQLVEDAALASSLEQGRSFMHLRHSLSEVQGYEGGSIKDDISVPIIHVADFIGEASVAALALIPGCRPVPFGHLGDGNIHFNVSQPVGADTLEFLGCWKEMNAVVHEIVRKYGGSISAEHGIGQLKRDLLSIVKDPVAYNVMQAIKATLDPKGLLNPGKVL